MTIPCRRINIFVEEPNTGKSNILEAIGLLSAENSNTLKGFIRLETLVDLFHKCNASKLVVIKTNLAECYTIIYSIIYVCTYNLFPGHPVPVYLDSVLFFASSITSFNVSPFAT